jgi:alpha-tubulin suppressor-like RCC1 family protein
MKVMKNVMYLAFLYLSLILLQSCTGGASTGTRGSSGGSGSSLGSNGGGSTTGNNNSGNSNSGNSNNINNSNDNAVGPGGNSNTNNNSGGGSGGGGSGGGAVVDPLAFRNDYLSSVAVGEQHVCAISNDQLSINCWGTYSTTYPYLLGTDSAPTSTIVRVDDRTVVQTSEPASSSSNPIKYIHITAGDFNTCVLTNRNQVYCWGRGAFGAIGNGTNANQNIPVPVLSNVAYVDAGGASACAIMTDKRVMCWGYNANRTLGLGLKDGQTTDTNANHKTTDSNFPYYVASARLINGTTRTLRAIHLAVGNVHVCAIEDADSLGLFCWGHNEYNMTGLNTSGAGTSYTPWPKQVSMPTNSTTSSSYKAWSVAASDSNSCELMEDRKIFCWGRADLGATGSTISTGMIDMPRADKPVLSPDPTGVQTSGYSARPFIKKIASTKHSSCSLDRNTRAAFCWGYNDQSQNGRCTQTGTSCTPAAKYLTADQIVDTKNANNQEGYLVFSDITGGGATVCGKAYFQPSQGAAEDTTLKVYCWGDNAYKQIKPSQTTANFLQAQEVPNAN